MLVYGPFNWIALREGRFLKSAVTDLRRSELSFAATPHLTRHFPYPARVSTK